MLGYRNPWGGRSAATSSLNRRALGLLGLLWLVLELGVILGHPMSALGATVENVTVATGPGSYTDPVTRLSYVKPSQTVTINVTTSPDTKCIEYRRSDDNKKNTVPSAGPTSFTITAPSAPGVMTVTVTAYGAINTNNNSCNGPGNEFAKSLIVDNTGPSVTGTLNPAPNAAGWNKSDVTIAWSATDPGGSGVATGPTPPVDSVTTDTPFAGVTRTATAIDHVGNTGTGTVAVRLDKTPPTITADRSPAPNAAGWNNTNVTVAFTCNDGLSGIKSCTGGSTTVTTEGADQNVGGTAVDNADNTNSAGVSVSIDKTAPTLTGAPVGEPDGTDPDGRNWYRGDVTVKWTATDALSGIAGSDPADGTIGGEGLDLFATASVSDKAGNTTIAESAGVNIDRTPPTTNATAPGGWTNTAQTIALVPSDNLSGVKVTRFQVDGGAPETGTSVPVSGDGEHTVKYWSEDYAGNVEAQKQVTVKIDGTKPTIGHTLDPKPNDAGWNRSNVKVHFVCDDAGGSGIAFCTPDEVVSTEGENNVVEGTATDNAGNSVTDSARVSLDKTAPTISAAPDRAPNANLAGNGKGWYSADVTVSYKCSDALSGIVACSSADTLREGYDQAAQGTAEDLAGNTSTARVTGINVDKTKPELSGTPTSAPTSNGWYRDDVDIEWTCSDALSGILGNCPAKSTITGEGADLVASASVSDRAGNVRHANSSPVGIDRTPPSTTASVPDPLSSGWYAGPVQVTLASIDNLSGVAATYYDVDGGERQSYSGPFKHALKGSHTIRFWSVDNAGNVEDRDAAGHSITLKIDDVAPRISGAQDPGANSHGWNNGPVTVTFTCSDDESGIASCLGNTRLTDETPEAGQTVTGNATDIAGNTAEATVGPIRIDLTAPTLRGKPTTSPNNWGWYNGDVTIEWTGDDGLSGVDPATVPANSVIDGQGKSLKAGPETVRDKAGNVSAETFSAGANIDRTPPTIAGATVDDDGAPRSANGAGWFNSAVRVQFTCDDELSGIQECANDRLLTTDGTDLSASGTAKDKADNTADATVDGINIDSHAPEMSAEVVCTKKNGYCSGDTATVKLTATDPAPADGVKSSGVKEIRYVINDGDVQTVPGAAASADVELDGSGKATVSYWSVDRAGNSSPVATADLLYDTIAPTVTHTLDPEANAAGWSRLDTTVHFDATDDADGSGVDPETVTPDQLVDEETAGLVIQGSAADKAGNVGTDSVTVKLDKTDPTISATASGTLGSNGWYRSPVTVVFACADPDGAAEASGIATCAGARELGHDETVTGHAVDYADNGASTTVGPFKVDTQPPVIDMKGVGDGGVYYLGAVPKASCTATDEGPSGVDGPCRVTVTGGLANGVGTFDFVATASDVAGNQTKIRGSYKVQYPVVTGTAFWQPPINDTAHTASKDTSVFKAGSTVPAKFRLVDATGKPVQTNTPPVWLTPEKAGATLAPVGEAVSTAAPDSDTFRVTEQQYIYNWSTPKNGAGFNWRVGVRLDDGTTQTIYIGLR